jgi:hypothetical protein
MGVKICVRDGEPIGKALRRFKKQLMLDGFWIAQHKALPVSQAFRSPPVQTVSGFEKPLPL